MSISTISIDGILSPVNVSLNEYTSPAIIAAYAAQMAILKEILNRTASNPAYTGRTPPPLTPADAINAKNAIIALQNLAINGVTSSTDWVHPDDTTLPQMKFYMTSQMGKNLDLVIKSLSAVGFTTLSFDVDNLKAWQNLAGLGVAAIVQAAVDSSSVSNNRSIQSFIELEYVTNANDVIFNNLNSLQTALSTTGTVLGTLQVLQDLHNKVIVSGPTNLGATFSIYFATVLTSVLQLNQPAGKPRTLGQLSPSEYADAYKAAANIYFGQVKPRANMSDAEALSAYNTLIQTRTTLSNYIIQLGIQAPGASRTVTGTLAFNLDKLLTDMNQRFTAAPLTRTFYRNSYAILNPGSDPVQQIKQSRVVTVTLPLTQAEINVFNGNQARAWVVDGRDGLPTETGVVQDHITRAITAAESLNDTQKENIRNYMFIFEEFYKSANTVLTKISQIIEKMAQGISR